MQERRKNSRFTPPSNVVGNFNFINGTSNKLRSEDFVVKDIGFGGLKVISSFLPDTGSDYFVQIRKDERELGLNVEVVHSNIVKLATADEGIFKAGAVYAIGCRIKSTTPDQREYIKYLIKRKPTPGIR
jgi:hypothetical protein